MRGATTIWRRRARQLSAHLGHYRGIAPGATHFRPRRLFHGVDKHRQPQSFAVFRLPWLKSLAHRMSLPERPRTPLPASIPTPSIRSSSQDRKNADGCELLHRAVDGIGLNLHHGPEDPPAPVRSTRRRRNRQRLDRRWRFGGPDRADLPHPDLIRPRAAGRARPGNGYRVAAKGSVRRTPVRSPPILRQATVKRNARQPPGFPSCHCVNRA